MQRTTDELEVLRSLRVSGPISCENMRQHAGGVSCERVRQLLKKAGDTSDYRLGAVDPIRLLRVIRSNSNVTRTNHLAKTFGKSFAEIWTCLQELGLNKVVERLFRLRRFRKRKSFEEKMLSHLRELSSKLGKTAGAQDVNRAGKFSLQTYQTHFGGMRNAQRLAGLIPNRSGRPSRPNSSISQ